MYAKSDILKYALEISKLRPKADKSIEQYLMTFESMARQVDLVTPTLRDKKIFFLGDDDHMSLLLSKYIGVEPVIGEFDSRIRNNLTKLHSDTGFVNRDDIFPYDARQPLKKGIFADGFYINPPYSSKNNGKGAKLWLYRALKTVPVGSTSILVYPVDETRRWTIDCLGQILDFSYKCGMSVVRIDRDAHTYEDLPKDPGLLSSNIYLYKLANTNYVFDEDIAGDALYR